MTFAKQIDAQGYESVFKPLDISYEITETKLDFRSAFGVSAFGLRCSAFRAFGAGGIVVRGVS
jgi:hypothetical protein